MSASPKYNDWSTMMSRQIRELNERVDYIVDSMSKIEEEDLPEIEADIRDLTPEVEASDRNMRRDCIDDLNAIKRILSQITRFVNDSEFRQSVGRMAQDLDTRCNDDLYQLEYKGR